MKNVVERLEKRIHKNYVDKFQFPPGSLKVSEKDFLEIMLLEFTVNPIVPYYGESGFTNLSCLPSKKIDRLQKYIKSLLNER